MKITHRFSLRPSQQIASDLGALGITLSPAAVATQSLVSFDVCETHSDWHLIKHLLDGCDAFDYVFTKFSSDEMNHAMFFNMTPAWHCGYPQPEAAFGYLDITYDCSQYCRQCGAGCVQKAPFRLKGEPRWGQRHICQLNWVFDEYFVLPEVWEHVFRPFGIEYLPVLDFKSGKKLLNVVQIVNACFTTFSPPDALTYSSEQCSVCQQRKYHAINRGMFPECVGIGNAQIARTQELFGSGASAHNAAIIGRTLFESLRDYKIKGVDFIPVASGLPVS